MYSISVCTEMRLLINLALYNVSIWLYCSNKSQSLTGFLAKNMGFDAKFFPETRFLSQVKDRDAPDNYVKINEDNTSQDLLEIA